MNVVEFILNLKDGATHPLGKLSKAASVSKYSLDDLTKANEKLKSVTDKTGNSIGSVKDQIRKLQEMKELLPINAVKQVKEVNEEIERLEKVLDRVDKKKQEGGGGVLEKVKGMLPAIAVGGTLVESINKGMESAKSKLDFEILVGKDSGDKLYEGLKKMKTQLGEGVFDLGKELADSMDASKIVPTIQRLGDVAKGDQAKLAGLTDQFSQLMKDGKLTEATMSGLEQNGFKPLVMISETTGQSLNKVRERFLAGKISAREVEKALKASTDEGGRFHGIMDAIANSPKGKLDEFLGKIAEITEWLGDKLLPVAMEFIDFLIAGFNMLKGPIETVINALKSIYKWVKTNKDILIPLVTVLGSFVAGIYAVVAAKAAWVAITTGLTTGIQAMSAAIMNIPVIGWILAAIAAIIAAVIYLRAHFTGFGKFFANLWQNARDAFFIFISYIKQGFSFWLYQHELAALKIKSFAQWVMGIFENIGKAIKAALNFDFEGAKQALTAKITTSASVEIDALKKKHQGDEKGYQTERAALLEDMRQHPLSGIIKKKLSEEGNLSATEKATGGRGNKGTATVGKTDLKGNGVADSLNAISGGGVKNITITVGKMFEKVEFVIHNGTKQMAYELERIAEEAVTRAIASASAK